MRSFWIEFEDGSFSCSQGQSDYDAKSIAEKLSGKKVKNMETLPYPASPIIYNYEHPVYGKTPEFCHSPKQCKGKTSCPHRYSCVE